MGVLDELIQKINNAPKEEREKHIAEAGIGLGKQEAINIIREACKKLKFKGDKYLTSALRRKDEESTRYWAGYGKCIDSVIAQINKLEDEL